MYIERIASKQQGKVYHQVLLRKSIRDKTTKKTSKETLANLSKENVDQVLAIEQILKKPQKSSGIPTYFDELHQGREAGTIIAFTKLMDQCGITKVLSGYRYTSQIQTLVFARICCQSSRLQAFDWHRETMLPEYRDFKTFGLQSLYYSLDQLSDNKEQIEDALFREYAKKNKQVANLYLYDVTSSYVEGEYENSELIKAGYNRDRKKGKQQIVFGLLTNHEGYALSGKVFAGNTNDVKTFETQIETLKQRFSLTNVTLVGDGGMIKSAGIEALQKYGYTYITSIGDAQIKTLMKSGMLQASLFDDDLHETVDEILGIRYITRRNPMMADEIQATRNDMIVYFRSLADKEVETLNEKKRGKKEVVERKLQHYLQRYHLNSFVSYVINGTQEHYTIAITIDETKKQQVELLDGCYCVKTNIPQTEKTQEEVHADYKKLITVENAFRTMKTELLEVRPLYLHLDKRIEGHLVVTMLAYNLVRHFENHCRKLNQTTTNMLRLLSHYTSMYLKIGTQKIEIFPKPHPTVSLLFESIGCKTTSKALRTCIQ